jgi:hypothetical protein
VRRRGGMVNVTRSATAIPRTAVATSSFFTQESSSRR